jgi:Leucine-rich repeat (LRR) protein
MAEKSSSVANSQAIHLLNQGLAIKTLTPTNITPSQVDLPENKRNRRTHQPVYINNSYIESKTTTHRVLDGFALLEASGLGFPEDSRKITISGNGYSSVIEEDLSFFTGLVYIDVSDNYFDFHCFEILPRLKELRIVCNQIENIGEVQGYNHLQALDISYNKLTQESVLSLAYLPNLRELDLSGNNLMTLPSQMCLFSNLERLVLEHNKFSDNTIFHELALLPMLRELGLAFNLLSVVPPQSCTEGKFRSVSCLSFRLLTSHPPLYFTPSFVLLPRSLLDTLDLAYNYFGTQVSLEPLLDLTRILTVIIYGNPVLGPSGEDPTGIYVEELIDSAYAARDGYTMKPLELITEIPKKRVLRKGGFVSGRHAIYKEFSVVHVENEMESLKKAAYEYKNEGNQTLFAQAVNLAKKNNLISTGSALQLPEYDFSSNTFLTGVGLVSNLPNGLGGTGAAAGGGSVPGVSTTGGGGGGGGGALGLTGSLLAAAASSGAAGAGAERATADNVMRDVAKEMNLLDLSDIDRLRRKMNRQQDPPPRAAGAGAEAVAAEGSIPIDIFDRSITDPHPLATYPVALNTALRSLRYAVEHPLTDHNTLPSTLSHPMHHHSKTTVASEKRQMPRRTADGQLLQLPKTDKFTAAASAALKTGTGTGVPGGAGAGGKKGEHSQQGAAVAGGTGAGAGGQMSLLPPNGNSRQPSVFRQSLSVRQRQQTVQSRQQINRQQRNTTLQQIEEVLDGLNRNTQDLVTRNNHSLQGQGGGGGGGQGNGPDSVMVRGVARPNTGVKGLIDMVNSVVFDLQS